MRAVRRALSLRRGQGGRVFDSMLDRRSSASLHSPPPNCANMTDASRSQVCVSPDPELAPLTLHRVEPYPDPQPHPGLVAKGHLDGRFTTGICCQTLGPARWVDMDRNSVVIPAANVSIDRENKGIYWLTTLCGVTTAGAVELVQRRGGRIGPRRLSETCDSPAAECPGNAQRSEVQSV